MSYELAGEIGVIDNEDMKNNKYLDPNSEGKGKKITKLEHKKKL